MTSNVSAPMRRSLSTSWPESAHIRGRGPSRPASVVSRTAVPNTTYSRLPGPPSRAADIHLDADHGVRARELRLLPQAVERTLARQVPGHSERRHLADPSSVGRPAVVLPAVLDDRGAHDLRDRNQTGGLRDRVLVDGQIAREGRRARRRDPLQTLLGSKRDPPASDALEINRRCLTLILAQGCRSSSEQWQSTSCWHIREIGLRGEPAGSRHRAGSASMVRVAVKAWGTASFENDPASDWFLLVEEAVEPGEVIASALDTALGDADHLGLGAAWEAIAAAELLASCAGHAPNRLPDDVRRWVDGHPHRPHDSETDEAILAVRARPRRERAARTVGRGRRRPRRPVAR